MGKPLVGQRKIAMDAARMRHGMATVHSKRTDWEMFGSGSMRDVWLHTPSQVVYKVNSWSDEDYGNEREHANARRLRNRKFQHVYIPKTSLFMCDGTPVLAMEYIVGPSGRDVNRDDYSEARQELFEKCRFLDMHGDNFVFILTGDMPKIAPIDMGSLMIPKNHHYEAPDRRVLSCGNGSVWGKTDDVWV